MSAPGEDTALGTARGRFVASLPRKAVELRGAIALLVSTPAAIAPRDEMRRRLQTLYASALVFRDQPLAELVKAGIERIDVAQEQGRGLTTYDLKVLGGIIAKLPTLHQAERGVAVLTAALRGEAPGLEAEPVPKVESPTRGAPAESEASLAETSNRDTRDSQGVAIANVQVRTRAISKPLAIKEVYEPRAKTLAGLPPVADSQPWRDPRRPESEPPARSDTERGLGAISVVPPAEADADADVDLPDRPTTVARPSDLPTTPASLDLDEPPLPERATVHAGDLIEAAAAELRDPAFAAPTLGSRAAVASSRAPLLQRVVHVLVVESPERAALLRTQLPPASFEVVCAEDAERGLQLARSEGPDVILASRELVSRGDFIRRLRSDPLTDFVPIVLLQGSVDPIDPIAARELGADDLLTRPVGDHLLAEAIGRVTGTLVDEGQAFSALSDATLGELAERVAGEIRQGLVDAAESGLDLRVPLGGGAEVLAAAWAAVARVRAFVSQQSGGRIRFRDLPTRGGPAVLALVEGGPTLAASTAQVSLQERCVLVVDDDPSVVWFFAGLLREEGAQVLEAADGLEALQLARRRRPDVVISDILMPRMDGFALCRELKRDPLLADVPVILLSWKEDLLHRMRELQAGASGYLRKEAASVQILARVREVLATQSRLEAALATGGDVRGSLEGIGLVPMLRSAARSRPSSRVTVRDAWNVFELELREGELRALTRTASDGTLARGESALPQLLGSSSGRFMVTDSNMELIPNVLGSLDVVLERAGRALGALIHAVSGAGLLKAKRVHFDLDAYATLQRQSPGPVRELVERLHQGQAPAELLLSGETSAQTLEAVLIDLARRGVIEAVQGSQGEDLVAEALRALGGAVAAARVPLDGDSTQPQGAQPAGVPAAEEPDSEAPTEPYPPVSEAQAQALSGAEEPSAAGLDGAADPQAELDSLEADWGAQPVATTASGASPPSTRPARPRREAVIGEPTRKPSRTHKLRDGESAAGEASLTWGWLAALAALALAGFVGVRLLKSDTPQITPEQMRAADQRLDKLEPAADRAAKAATQAAEPAESPVEDVLPGAHLTPLASAEGLVVPQDVGFQIYEGITDSTVDVGDDQGLLIVGARPGGPAALKVDGEDAGRLPLKLALSEGIHELELSRGDSLRYLFVSIGAGKTWVLAKP